MAEPLITTGELLADPDGKPLPAPVQETEVRSVDATRMGEPTMSADELARNKAAFERQAPPTPAQIPVPAPQVKPKAGVPPPPSEGATWLANTPYGEAKSRAAAAAKGLIDPLLGVAQLGERGLRTPLELGRRGLATLSGKPYEAPTYLADEATRSIHNVLGEMHPELSPKTEITGAVINPVGLGVGKGLNAVKSLGLYPKAALAGAAGGASAPVDDIEHYWGTKIGDMGWGTAMGVGTQAVANTVGKVLAPRVQKAIETLKAQGLDPSKLTLGQLLGGKAASFENWVRDTLPGSGIKPAQERGAREFQVAPLRQVGQSVGHAIDENAPIPKIAADLVGGADDQGNRVAGAIDNTYAAARNSAPALGIEMKAVPNKAGTTFNLNQGTPRFLNSVQKEGESWAGQSKDGKKAWDALKTDINESLKPFNLDFTTSKHYASAEDLHNAIKYLNGRISGVSEQVSKEPGNMYNKKLAGALSDVRDHLRNLWENTDQGSYDLLRSADRAHGASQTILDAMKGANLRGGAYTPEDLLRASAHGESIKNIASRSGNYAPYATAGQEVLGATKEPASLMTLPGMMHALGTKAIPAAGAAGVGALGAMGHPAVAAGAGLGALGSLAASRALYGPTLNLGNRWANPGPARLALRDSLEGVPAYLSGAYGAKP